MIAASARFPTTSWTCIQRAQDPSHPQFVIAMNRLIGSYWKPVYHFLRAHGHNAAEAEDRTQEFFLRFWANNWVQPADQGRGRFRSLLLTMLKRYVYSKTVRASNKEKFAADGFISIQSLMRDEDRRYEPPAQETPEDAFERQWREQMLIAARQNLQRYYEGSLEDKERRKYEVFAACHFSGQDHRPTQEALATQFQLSRDQVRYALEEVRKRYERFLSQEIRDQVSSEDDVKEEMKKLVGVS